MLFPEGTKCSVTKGYAFTLMGSMGRTRSGVGFLGSDDKTKASGLPQSTGHTGSHVLIYILLDSPPGRVGGKGSWERPWAASAVDRGPRWAPGASLDSVVFMEILILESSILDFQCTKRPCLT